ncbi:MAG: C4-type zinc ribbon domain-containing protein [Actinomycetota bacterium]|nr:C4-type zinc ribbon domain-containing protein [Actinomycetota bacterium]
MADPALEALLEVQAADLATDRLRYRRETLPERAALREHRAALAELDGQLAGLRARAEEFERTQRRMEDEISGLQAKAADSERRLYSGAVGAPRELQALSDEVEALQRRQRRLEDDVLDVMELAEPLTAEIPRLVEERGRLTAEAERLQQAIAEHEDAVARELAEQRARRDAAAAGVPADLLRTYEGLRSRLGGVGAARLDAGRCTGCHLGLPAVELDAVRRAPEGAIVRHEECGRILVP